MRAKFSTNRVLLPPSRLPKQVINRNNVDGFKEPLDVRWVAAYQSWNIMFQVWTQTYLLDLAVYLIAFKKPRNIRGDGRYGNRAKTHAHLVAEVAGSQISSPAC